MPIYEYQCDHCHHRLECIQKIDDDPLLTCPECDQDSLRKLVSAASFRLKGTGWYATDFKDKPAGQNSKKETSSPSNESSKTEEKKDSKSTDSSTTDKKEAGSTA